MSRIVLLGLLVATVYSQVISVNTFNRNGPVYEQSIIDEVNNSPTASWKAGHNEFFANKTFYDVESMLVRTDLLEEENNDVDYLNEEGINNDLPENFDGREKFGQCIHPVRNQLKCGSCWAFAASEVLGDRWCIGGRDLGPLSPQYLVSCDASDMGCNGGNLVTSWSFIKKYGIPTDECYPYTSGDGHRGTCYSTCTDGSQLTRYSVKSAYRIKSRSTCMNDLFTLGPVETGFRVYQDFMTYKSGVYHHVTGKLLGGHAVKIIGWGVENGVDYWLVVNSWGETWGDGGLFKIRRGHNDCHFETQFITGKP